MASSAFAAAGSAVGPLDEEAARAAAAHHDRLTKPRGALGRLEACGIQLAAISGLVPPPLPRPAGIAVFAADHGVLAQGVTPWPKEVTAQMVANFCAGGAAINVLARQVGASVTVVDVGVDAELPVVPGLRAAKIRYGTADLAEGDAMTVDEARAALDVGAQVAADLVGAGARCLVTGDMGIGNTTPSAAIVATFTGRRAAEVTGRGTGIDDEALVRKTDVVQRALRRTAGLSDPLELAAAIGGLEIVALAGFCVGAAAARVPVVVDGVIALAALCLAEALVPGVSAFAIAGHRSTEPGATAALEHLGLAPLLDLELRLGEGTGACLALPLVEASARILGEMATFDGAGITDKEA
jgi:nicotinate-nucleotide--dimethylbenzimidazole phosphoribosyltransferase